MSDEIDVSELRCIDQVRQGDRQGAVVEAARDTVRIQWDGEAAATSYSRKEIGELALILTKRGPSLLYSEPAANRFRGRRRRSTSRARPAPPTRPARSDPEPADGVETGERSQADRENGFWPESRPDPAIERWQGSE